MADNPMRSARLPFGDWYYFPRYAQNIVKLTPNPAAAWKPVHVSIAITSQCEKNCDFCYAESRRGREGAHWRFHNILELIESCDQNGVFGVTLGGGEPTLWRDETAKIDFYDLLHELRVFGCDIAFTTSGQPAPQWKKIPQNVVVRLSLHCHQEIDYINHEVQKSRDATGRFPAVNILVRKGATAEILMAAARLAETGVRDFLLIPLRAAGRAIGSNLIPNEAELRQLVQSFPFDSVKLSSCCHLENQQDTFLGCGAGDWFVSIDEKSCIKSCSYSKTGVSLSDFTYQAILDAQPYLARLNCHSRIHPDAHLSPPEGRGIQQAKV